MQSEPLIHWPEPFVQLFEFVGAFLAAGGIGFRYAVIRDRLGRAVDAADPGAGWARAAYQTAARRAALIGLVGAVIGAAHMAAELPDQAARRHVTVAQAVTGSALTAAGVALALLAIVGFALAARHREGGSSIGWPLAAVGVVAGSLRGALAGEWLQLVNPIHMLAAGLWIGTLFVLVVAGLAIVLGDEGAGERRGAIVADMVNSFSPVALTMGGVVVLFGLITAWRHLKSLDALWTTPYGYALIAKLCVVAVVFALGAWNWRRQRPQLGGEGGAVAIRRSATAELSAAAVVLLITSILVSLPSPREGHGPPGTPPGAAEEEEHSH